MKTNKSRARFGSSASLLALVGVLIAGGSFAESPPAAGAPPIAMPEIKTIPAGETKVPDGVAGGSAPSVLPMPGGAQMAIGLSDPKGEVPKGLTNFDSKPPSSVKDVVKRFDNATDDVTLDDLNTARQAIAKLDALIDIEKHLAELDKVRKDRVGKSATAAPLPIPASALMPTVPMAPTAPQPMAFIPRSPSSVFDVLQIVGGAGTYAAIVKSSDGKTSTIHAGDHLSNNTMVHAIMPTGVEIIQGTTKRLVRIKDVGPVYGRNP